MKSILIFLTIFLPGIISASEETNILSQINDVVDNVLTEDQNENQQLDETIEIVKCVEQV